MDAMNAMKKASPIIFFLALIALSPTIALAGTLPNKQPSPEMTACSGGVMRIPVTSRSLFGLDLSTGTAGYQCDLPSGSDNYRLYYDNSGKYLGGLSLNEEKYFDTNGDYNVNAVDPRAVNSLNTAAINAAKCNLTSFTFQACFWFPLISWLGSWFLTLGGTALRLAGALFDFLIQHVVIGFGETIRGSISDTINLGWTILRDVMNIGIIGMFVFIAIAIMLGLKTYGDKRLVAHLLIVAIFVNFSLLFTRMVIDFSNFSAYQFYAVAATTSGTDVANFDIAEKFLKSMGITSVWDTKPLTDAAGSSASGNSSTAAFFYGLVGGIMLLGVAAVLAYGVFVIAIRGILFIFLMLTAAAAFATYAIPKLSDSQYGWSGWWKSLINAAIFAPLLMIFLFISLRIIEAAGVPEEGALAKFIMDPNVTVKTGWHAILNYILVIGLLFASFKISSSIAGSATGLMNPSQLALGAARMASKFTALPGVGYALGKFGYSRAAKSEVKAKQASHLAGLAERSYDIHKDINPEIAKQAKAEAKRQELLAARYGRRSARAANWASSKAFSSRIGDRVKAAASAVKSATPDRDEVRKVAHESVIKERTPDLEQQKAEVAKAVRASTVQNNVFNEIQNQQVEAQKRHDDILLEAAKNAGHDHSELTPRAVSGDDESGMRLESARIESVRNKLIRQAMGDGSVTANPDVQNAEKALTAAKELFTVVKKHQTEAEEKEEDEKGKLSKLEREIRDAAKKAGTEAVEAVTETTRRVAERVGARGVGLIPNILDRSASARATVKTVRAKKTEARLLDIIREAGNTESSENSSPPTPGATTT